MFNFCSLYSGSTGNSFFVQTSTTKILIDCGESAKKITSALLSINIDISDINAILVTHEHIDHVRGLGTISKRYNIPVYANYETWEAMPEQKAKITKDNIKLFDISKEFNIGDLKIFPFNTPHDAANPCGFNVFYKNKKISIATDLGHINSDVLRNLENSSFIMLESNYDPEILKCSSYPYSLKQRISGPDGHLSNCVAGQTISHLMNSGLKHVMLGHLSKENNFPELAYKTVVEQLISNNFNENTIKLSVATRYDPTSLINLLDA